MPVSGSDARESATAAALRDAGATVHIGHDAANVAGADTVVVSTAIRDANPEVVEAHRLGLRVLRRAAALAAVMAGRRGIAVALGLPALKMFRDPGFRVLIPDIPVRRELSGTETVLSIDKARRLLGFEPQHSWRDAG